MQTPDKMVMMEVMTMGMLDRLNPFSKSSDETVDIDEDFQVNEGESIDDTIEEELTEEEVTEVDEEAEPDIPEEWDSAYQFAEWYLQDEGFADMVDFGEKAMMYKLERSPMFRDRIESGLNTLGAIREARDNLKAIRGEDSENSNYGELADKVEDADRLISGIRSLSGEDEMMVQQGMGLAQEAIQAIASRGGGGGGDGGVSTETRATQESIE
jgi:hypothetical protein